MSARRIMPRRSESRTYKCCRFVQLLAQHPHITGRPKRSEFLVTNTLQMIDLNAIEIHEIDTLGHLSFARRSWTLQRAATQV